MKKIKRWIFRNYDAIILWSIVIMILLTAVFLTLKATNIIDWSFSDIFKPIIIPCTITGLLFFGYGCLMILSNIGQWAQKRLD